MVFVNGACVSLIQPIANTKAIVMTACRGRLPSLFASTAFKLLLCGGTGLFAGACSIPISGFVDDAQTGSIDRASLVLSRELDQEDWRRAKAALAVALDPQGNGENVEWANPQSGAKGSFAAAAAAYSQSEKLCRHFIARVDSGAGSGREVDGSACRRNGGEWLVSEARERKRAKA